MKRNGKTNIILAKKTALLWKEYKYKNLNEDKNLQCLNCGKIGATKLPFVTWLSNITWQVGKDPVGLIRNDFFSILCHQCREQAIRELEKAGDFWNEPSS